MNKTQGTVTQGRAGKKLRKKSSVIVTDGYIIVIRPHEDATTFTSLSGSSFRWSRRRTEGTPVKPHWCTHERLEECFVHTKRALIRAISKKDPWTTAQDIRVYEASHEQSRPQVPKHNRPGLAKIFSDESMSFEDLKALLGLTDPPNA